MSELSIPLSSDKTESCCLLFTTLKIFLSHLVQIKPGLNASLTANLIMSDFLSHLVQIKPSIQRNNSKNDRLSIPLSSDKTFKKILERDIFENLSIPLSSDKTYCRWCECR